MKKRLGTFASYESFRRMFYAACLIVFVLVYGTAGYMYIEKWTFFDSLYMTVITIATVGFHEVGKMTAQGRVFTIVLIFMGIGVGGYAIGNIAAFLVEGQMLNILKDRKMERAITSLKDHIIVCGYGKTGSEVCDQLANMGEEFIVIDSDGDKISEALSKGYIAAVGEATDDDILEKAGIRNAKGLISAVSDDSANVYLVLTARALNENLRIIARGAGTQSIKKMIRAGANKVVSPYEIGAKRMAALMVRPAIVEFVEAFTPGSELGLTLEKVVLEETSKLVGKKLNESYIKRDTNGALILGIEKPGQSPNINPDGETLLKAGDTLLAIGTEAQIALLKQLVR